LGEGVGGEGLVGGNVSHRGSVLSTQESFFYEEKGRGMRYIKPSKSTKLPFPVYSESGLGVRVYLWLLYTITTIRFLLIRVSKFCKEQPEILLPRRGGREADGVVKIYSGLPKGSTYANFQLESEDSKSLLLEEKGRGMRCIKPK
jgi:hypothetical protein